MFNFGRGDTYGMDFNRNLYYILQHHPNSTFRSNFGGMIFGNTKYDLGKFGGWQIGRWLTDFFRKIIS
jgi:hypothetical protein